MTTPTKKPLRNNDLAVIHMAWTALEKAVPGLDRAAYEDTLWTVARVRSSKDLDMAGRRRVRAHLDALLKRHGIRLGELYPPVWRFIATAPAERKAMYKAIFLMAKTLGKSKAWVESIASRMSGVHGAASMRLEMCSAEVVRGVVGEMKEHIRRQDAKAGKGA